MLKSKDRREPSLTFMSGSQMGQQPPMFPTSSPLHTPPKASRLRECTTLENTGSPTRPTASYLSHLRSSRPARPSGARPPPSSKFSSLQRADTDITDLKHKSDDERPCLPTSNSMPAVPGERRTHHRSESSFSRSSTSSASKTSAGRPLARPPSTTPEPVLESAADDKLCTRRTPSISYMEHGLRWMEKQEAKSLRRALEDMDLKAERRLHSAAQDEAAELVWKHKNPEMADAPKVFANPDLKDYHSHLRKGSYARSHSQETASGSQRSASEGSQSSSSSRDSDAGRVRAYKGPRKVSPPTGLVSVSKRRESSGKNYDDLKEAVAKDIAVAHRRSSSGNSKRVFSSEKKLFMHPNDRIWEDADEEKSPPKMQPVVVDEPRQVAPAQVPSYVRKNPFARVRAQYDRMERSNSAPTIPTSSAVPAPKNDPVEIQRNPPSQTRNPWYRSNEPLPPTPPSRDAREADDVAPKTTPTKEGKEIRGDDIRAATSKVRKDYSPNLPRPTMVSDKPGRPIVSFRKDWGPCEVVMEEQQFPEPCRSVETGHSKAGSRMPASIQSAPAIPQIKIDESPKPPIPTINLPDEPTIPSIVLPEEPFVDSSRSRVAPAISVAAAVSDTATPSINVSGPVPGSSSSARNKVSDRPVPSSRPLPRHAATAPVTHTRSTPHYTPSIRQSGTLCAHCALPIAGRILSAAGERFHPGCFVCHQCSTNLELVAFYPEPERARAERLERIQARHEGIELDMPEKMTAEDLSRQEAEDGDETLRFYCHLDFHELFSPRCKSCKTPIEGEVVVACGAEWHVGHFFCAQCGDPFDSTMPFVEKDGYAWCVGCHTNRYSSKCRKCKKPVTDVVVKALGSDWHSDCFVCMECYGEFEDGRYFLRGDSQDPVCVKCEERRLKA